MIHLFIVVFNHTSPSIPLTSLRSNFDKSKQIKKKANKIVEENREKLEIREKMWEK
jgi:hypothetical protein